MNRTQINRHMTKLVDQIIDDILELDPTAADDIRDIRDAVVIAGGCFVQLLRDEEPNDYDVYFTDPHAAVRVANIFLGRGAEAIYSEGTDRVIIHNNRYRSPDDEETTDEKSKGDGTRVVFVTPTAVTLSNKVQLIVQFYGEPQEIVSMFDFVHCTCWWHGGEVSIPLEAVESMLTSELRYMGSTHPVASLVRLRKYIQRGWKVNAGQILKMAVQVSQLDLSNPNTLRNQLIGVDVSHFRNLLVAIEQGNDEKLDLTYVTRLIDTIF